MEEQEMKKLWSEMRLFFLNGIGKMKRGTSNVEVGLGSKIMLLSGYSRKLSFSKWCCPASEPGI